jgi:hypothetical protein
MWSSPVGTVTSAPPACHGRRRARHTGTTGGTNRYVYLWEMPAGTILAHPLDPGGAEIADLAFSSDGATAAVLDVTDRIFLWRVTGGGG